VEKHPVAFQSYPLTWLLTVAGKSQFSVFSYRTSGRNHEEKWGNSIHEDASELLRACSEGCLEMLVSEVRDVLKKYQEEDLRLLLVEMYKAMPKKLKEDKEIDMLLQDVHGYMSARKAPKAQERQIDLESLKFRIDQFVEYAYNQYYYAPNSYVHKKDRPKWRFQVRAFIKDLQTFPADSEEGKIATDLLHKLYEMLSYACGYYIFSTDSPFGSVGTKQVTLLDLAISRKLASGLSKESLKSAIALAINSRVDRETLDSCLISVLVDNLKTPDARESAIEQCVELKKELEKAKTASSKKRNRGYYQYEQERKLNNLVEMVFRIQMDLREYEKAISYFKRSYIEQDQEVTLYVLLDLLGEYEVQDYWIREYNEAMKRGVTPRESLQRMYVAMQKEDKIREYIF
jgi:hypothetical protein